MAMRAEKSQAAQLPGRKPSILQVQVVIQAVSWAMLLTTHAPFDFQQAMLHVSHF